MQVLGLSGSLRPGSFNTRLLGAAAAALPPGTRMATFHELGALPPYREDIPTPVTVDRFCAAIRTADAMLIATPEYNGSVPGQLKNALDWASRPFPDNALRARPTAVVGASTGLFGAVWAQAELRKILAVIGARVLDAELPVGMAHEAFDTDGTLIDAGLRARLADIVEQLLGPVRHLDLPTDTTTTDAA